MAHQPDGPMGRVTTGDAFRVSAELTEDAGEPASRDLLDRPLRDLPVANGDRDPLEGVLELAARRRQGPLGRRP